MAEVKECGICLDPMEVDKMRPDKCIHQFHGDCLHNWWERNPTCPLCRRQFCKVCISSKEDNSDEVTMNVRDWPIRQREALIPTGNSLRFMRLDHILVKLADEVRGNNELQQTMASIENLNVSREVVLRIEKWQFYRLRSHLRMLVQIFSEHFGVDRNQSAASREMEDNKLISTALELIGLQHMFRISRRTSWLMLSSPFGMNEPEEVLQFPEHITALLTQYSNQTLAAVNKILAIELQNMIPHEPAVNQAQLESGV